MSLATVSTTSPFPADPHLIQHSGNVTHSEAATLKVSVKATHCFVIQGIARAAFLLYGGPEKAGLVRFFQVAGFFPGFRCHIPADSLLQKLLKNLLSALAVDAIKNVIQGVSVVIHITIIFHIGNCVLGCRF